MVELYSKKIKKSTRNPSRNLCLNSAIYCRVFAELLKIDFDCSLVSLALSIAERIFEGNLSKQCLHTGLESKS
ncbi:hypothetical protein BpHYR1_044899 [Brachionus plicatilis]|uniref:Uncharacterized protein n=1 Tax=Brachionus plicatilis TaxID=10195 RepID=A0A3M7P2A8_BRAPC|nr:hypothetical protein BpHYR1_044899 [Brachionus plicatilis]